MAILAGDVKLLKSAVMDDVPEGGGAPTANVVIDGASNAVFPDIGETDRAAGRVSLRKLHVWIQSDDVDTYIGGNVIVARPPNDPNVSVTLCTTNDTFDRRDDAVAKIEAYLNIGANYPGYLYGNHIEGQSTILIYQKTDALPPIGATLVLTKREGFSDEHRQYVRVSEAKTTLIPFEDDAGTYTRYILELKLTTALDADFPGFDMSRLEYTKAQMAALTKVSDTVVADAAKYYGVVPLEDEASIGDFSIKAVEVFSQLVPSAQIETPIADARTNQLLAPPLSSGGAVNRSVSAIFDTTHNFFVGGQIAPGSLSISSGGVTLTDSGGRLMNAGTSVGTVDYENGMLSLATNLWGVNATATFTVGYSVAGSPDGVTQSMGFIITPENRSTSYVRTIEPPPAPGSMQISYMVQGRWYVLRDAGDGALRGADSAYGAGQVNFTTGTIVLTLGYLPDVGSDVIYQWIEPEATRESDSLELLNDGKLYWVFNTTGEPVESEGDRTIEPGGLTITWNHGGTRTVTDNGAGLLQGYGTGSVDYARGIIKLSPTLLPPPGTPINVNCESRVRTSDTVAVGSGTGNLGATNIEPGSVLLIVLVQRRVTYGAVTSDVGSAQNYGVRDDGAGNLRIWINDEPIVCGTINYATGAFTLTSTVAMNGPQTLQAYAFETFYERTNDPIFNVEVV